MGELYPIDQSCQYVIARAARHRRAGRYDHSMLLLNRAIKQFGSSESLEYELARTYDEMECEDEACRHYLRIVLADGKYKAQALFHLSLTAAQRADLKRAISYFEAFCVSDRGGISHTSVELLHRQLLNAAQMPAVTTRRQRAKALESRAVQCLHAGRIFAAGRTVEHSLRLHLSAQGCVLKACCYLLRGEGIPAKEAAELALQIKPGYIQACCILADANMMTGDRRKAKKILIHAVACARSSAALLNVAIECAKYGFDQLTLIVTRRLIKRDPYHIQALSMRACALANTGCIHQAKKLFARLCVLLPDSSIFSAYYQLLEAGDMPRERFSLALDVPQETAMDRCVQLLSMVHEEPDELRKDPIRVREIIQLADWAIHSAMTGDNVTTMAIIILSVLNTVETRQVLLDALVDVKLDDNLKYSVLQALTAYNHEIPTYADLDGKFVRLAAGTMTPEIKGAACCQDVVQQAATSLLRCYPDTAEVLLRIWTAYLERYDDINSRNQNALAAALEYAYHLCHGRQVDMKRIAVKHGASRRLSMLYARRMLRMENLVDKRIEQRS